MERPNLATFMIMVTAIGVIAPAAEWIKPAPAQSSEQFVTASSPQPKRSSNELRVAMESDSQSHQVQPINISAHSSLARLSRSPFELVMETKQNVPVEEPMPVINLIGIMETPRENVATLEIDGTIVTLRAGESSGRVKLQTIGLPDTAVVEVGKRKVAVRVQ